MAADTPINEKDVRAMVRLLGEVAANPGDHAAKKRHLMEGLRRLVNADAWVWGVVPSKPVLGKPPVSVMIQSGGINTEQLGLWQRVSQHPAMIAATVPFVKELAEKRTHLTRFQHQFDPAGNVTKGPVADLMRAAGLGPFMASFRPLDSGHISGIMLHRRPDRPYFGAREARIAHVVLTEVPWLHLAGWSEKNVSRLPTLSARPRTVMNLLISGLSRKEIAASLKISQHTANGYVKTVFRHFGVHSQSELVGRFLRGDGGDTP